MNYNHKLNDKYNPNSKKRFIKKQKKKVILNQVWIKLKKLIVL